MKGFPHLRLRARDRLCASLAACLLLGEAGCHSAFIEATVVNQSGAPISVVEVDYPSASFGTQSLAPSGVYRYKFKVQGSGKTKLLWIDAGQHDHASAGPALQEDQEGSLLITIRASDASWAANLHPPAR